MRHHNAEVARVLGISYGQLLLKDPVIKADNLKRIQRIMDQKLY